MSCITSAMDVNVELVYSLSVDLSGHRITQKVVDRIW